MKVIVEGTLLEISTNEYEYEGKKGTSYKLQIYNSGKLESVKIQESDIPVFKDQIGDSIRLECGIFVNGRYSVSYKSEE